MLFDLDFYLQLKQTLISYSILYENLQIDDSHDDPVNPLKHWQTFVPIGVVIHSPPFRQRHSFCNNRSGLVDILSVGNRIVNFYFNLSIELLTVVVDVVVVVITTTH